MGTLQKTPALLDGTGKTLLGVSRNTGIDKGYLSRIFSGKQRPGLATAERIAAFLGWDLGDLTSKLSEIRNNQK